MKLLLASSSPPDRGSGINGACRNLCEGLVALGCEVHMLAPTPTSRTWLEEHGVLHVPCGQSESQRDTARRVLAYVHEVGFDGAINNDNSLLQSLAPVLPCPLVAIGHMTSTSIATLACFNLPWLDYVVAISSDMQQLFTTRFGVPVEKCPVVYNGMTDPLAGAALTARVPGPLRVVYAGGESYNKGARVLRAAIERAPAAWQGVRLDWFGVVSAGFRARIPAACDVHFHGRVPRPEFLARLAAADVFLLPSYAEGCPMALIEAMSFGAVPITSAGTGAMRWLVTSGQDGFVCDIRHWPVQLAGCLRLLRDETAMLAGLRAAARARYLDELQSSAVAARLLALLRRPMVARTTPSRRVVVLRWHRPLLPGSDKAPIIDRLSIRSGRLRVEGTIDVPVDAGRPG